jgi:hypothetical protein
MSFILTLKDMPEGVFSVVDKDTGDHAIITIDDFIIPPDDLT